MFSVKPRTMTAAVMLNTRTGGQMAREQSGLSQEKFAGYFSIPKRTYQDWEYGKRNMPDYLLRLMLYKLKMDNMTEDLTKYLPEE